MSDLPMYLLTMYLLAQAPEPADAPKAEPEKPLLKLDSQPLDVRVLQAGDPAPSKGCWSDENTCLFTAKRIADAEAKVARFEKERSGFPWIPVTIAVLGGLTAGYFIHAAAFPNNPASTP